MNSSLIGAILPFWILGLPLAVAFVRLMELPKQRDLVPREHCGQRRNVTGEHPA